MSLSVALAQCVALGMVTRGTGSITNALIMLGFQKKCIGLKKNACLLPWMGVNLFLHNDVSRKAILNEHTYGTERRNDW